MSYKNPSQLDAKDASFDELIDCIQWPQSLSRQSYIEQLMRGSPSMVLLKQAGLELGEILDFIQQPAYAELVRRAHNIMTHNVVSKLYLSAMEGDLRAISFWLAAHPVDGWAGRTNWITDKYGTLKQLNLNGEADELNEEQLLQEVEKLVKDLGFHKEEH